MIRTNLAAVFTAWSMADDPVLTKSVTKILLAFEYYQPSIGYVPGLEKIAFFYRKIADEPSAFSLMFNTLFNSKLIWCYLEGRKTVAEQCLKVLERMVLTKPQLKKAYECNKPYLDKFLMEQGSFIYLDVFDPSIVE